MQLQQCSKLDTWFAYHHDTIPTQRKDFVYYSLYYVHIHNFNYESNMRLEIGPVNVFITNSLVA